MFKVFSYSTLRLPQVIQEVLGVIPPHTQEEVIGKIVKHEDNYEDLVPGLNKINGKLYSLTSKQLEKLIDWEKRYYLEKSETVSGIPCLFFKMKSLHHSVMKMPKKD